MPKFYVESTTGSNMVIDSPSAEDAARALIVLRPDVVYSHMLQGKDVYICANEKGFGSQIRTDMIFSVTELIKKKES